MNAKRIYRLYKEMGLQLQSKTPKPRVKAKLREDRSEATMTNETWAMDFVHDQLVTGRKIRVLTIVDTYSRFSPATDPWFIYRGEDVVLEALHLADRLEGGLQIAEQSRVLDGDAGLMREGLEEIARGLVEEARLKLVVGVDDPGDLVLQLHLVGPD